MSLAICESVQFSKCTVRGGNPKMRKCWSAEMTATKLQKWSAVLNCGRPLKCGSDMSKCLQRLCDSRLVCFDPWIITIVRWRHKWRCQRQLTANYKNVTHWVQSNQNLDCNNRIHRWRASIVENAELCIPMSDCCELRSYPCIRVTQPANGATNTKNAIVIVH